MMVTQGKKPGVLRVVRVDGPRAEVSYQLLRWRRYFLPRLLFGDWKEVTVIRFTSLVSTPPYGWIIERWNAGSTKWIPDPEGPCPEEIDSEESADAAAVEYLRHLDRRIRGQTHTKLLWEGEDSFPQCHNIHTTTTGD